MVAIGAIGPFRYYSVDYMNPYGYCVLHNSRGFTHASLAPFVMAGKRREEKKQEKNTRRLFSPLLFYGTGQWPVSGLVREKSNIIAHLRKRL